MSLAQRKRCFLPLEDYTALKLLSLWRSVHCWVLVFFSSAPLEGIIALKGCLRGDSCAAGCPTSALFLLLSLQNACIWKSMVFPAVWRGFLSLHPTADLRHSAVAAGGLIALLQLLLHWGSSVLLAGAGEQHGCLTEWEQFSPPCIYALGSSFVWEIWEKNLLDPQGVEYTEPFPVIMTKEEDPFSFWLACSWEDLHVKCVSEYFVIHVSLSKQGLDDPHLPNAKTFNYFPPYLHVWLVTLLISWSVLSISWNGPGSKAPTHPFLC